MLEMVTRLLLSGIMTHALVPTTPVVRASLGKSASDVKVAIAMHELGNALFPGDVRREGLSLRETRDVALPIQITNLSNQTKDFYVDESAWGDEALTFTVYTHGKPVTIRGGQSNYWYNTPAIVRLRPGETFTREVHYNSKEWQNLHAVLAGLDGKVTLRVGLSQSKIEQDPQLWVGHVESLPIVIPLD